MGLVGRAKQLQCTHSMFQCGAYLPDSVCGEDHDCSKTLIALFRVCGIAETPHSGCVTMTRPIFAAINYYRKQPVTGSNSACALCRAYHVDYHLPDSVN